jgi:hypothetical protein
MLSSPNRPLSEQKSERWPNMLRWRVNVASPGGGVSSDGSTRAVAGRPGGGCEKGCRNDRRRMADDGRRSLMAEEAKSFRSYCLARKRSEKAKGRAGASPRAPATPSRPSAPLRLARAGSSTTRLHLSRREEGPRPEDQGRRTDGLPVACRLLRPRSRCRLFPLWRDFSANSMRRGMAALAASLSSRIHRGERDKIGPGDTARRAQAKRR